MPHSILLVDDNVELVELLALSLKVLGGYIATVATDGIMGIELAMTSRPDCIVVDVMMPGLDGFQFVRALRGDQQTEDIPLIILTAVPQEKGRFSGLASGADYYLTKPVTITDLVDAIQRAIATSNADRAERLQHLATTDEEGPIS